MNDEGQVCDELAHALHIVRCGESLLKYGRRGQPHVRQFHVDSRDSYIRWESRKKKSYESCVDLWTIDMVLQGQKTSIFARGRDVDYSKCNDDDEKSFSLVYRGDRTLDIVCENSAQRRIWFNALNHLIKKRKDILQCDPTIGWLRDQWLHATNGVSTLNLPNFVKVLKYLNQQCTIDDTLNRLNTKNCNVQLTFEDLLLYRTQQLSTPLIVELFQQYSAPNLNGERRMNNQNYCRFLALEQFESNHHDIIDEDDLSIDDFINKLVHCDNSIFNPCQMKLYHDMNQSFDQYLIASSHNTYLVADQFTGNSCIRMYASALRRGCRCIELDCWDGPNNEPIIYHGHTLTSRISFKNCIETIRDHAFITSSYPVIISLENHCGLQGQRRMVDYLEEILGEMIAFPVNNEQSPHQLCGRILIKAKLYRSSSANNRRLKSTNSMTMHNHNVNNDDDDECMDILPELARLIYFPSVKCNTLNRNCVSIVSISERRLNHVINRLRHHYQSIRNNENELRTKFKHQIFRVYPSRYRVDSSNFIPIRAWSLNIQMCAMNYQTHDLGMLLNYAKFQENGECGYLHHHPSIRVKRQNTIRFTIISALQLPKRRMEDVCNPLIKLTYFTENNSTMEFKTNCVNHNGLWPYWGTTFEWNADDDGMIAIQIMDHSSIVAQNAISLNCMRLGIRFLPLLSPTLTQLPPSIGLLCRIHIENRR